MEEAAEETETDEDEEDEVVAFDAELVQEVRANYEDARADYDKQMTIKSEVGGLSKISGDILFPEVMGGLLEMCAKECVIFDFITILIMK